MLNQNLIETIQKITVSCGALRKEFIHTYKIFNKIFKASALWDHLSVCLFTFEVPFKRLFAPTSRNQISKIFRDSESLGKTNGKKWSQI